MQSRPKREHIGTKLNNAKATVGKNVTGGAGAILGKLFQSIMLGLNIDSSSKWNYHMDKYISDTRNEIKTDRRSQSSARGNLQKELLKSSMSWRVFCKGLRFLLIKRFTITIHAYHINGKITIHNTNVDLGDRPDLIDEE